METKEAVKKLLTDAKKLIRKGWTFSDYARDKDGTSVYFYQPEACRFCSVGAMKRATLDNNFGNCVYENAYTYLGAAVREVNGNANVVAFNDAPNRKKKEVLDVFSKAISSIG